MPTEYTPTFTASNGLDLEHAEDGHLLGDVLNCYGPLSPDGVEALREYFQYLRDKELNRWRDPVNPDLVVYQLPENDNLDGRAVRVMDETTGHEYVYVENNRTWWEVKAEREAADRYFEAHPETQPWEEAESGDIWELTGADGLKQVWVRNETGGWVSINEPKVTYYDGKGVTAGRRIWPEED